VPVPVTEVVLVNGRIARDMLAHNNWHRDHHKVDAHQPGNRRVSTEHLDGLVATLLAGDWQLTHQGVGFDTLGNLVDGQHRLIAIQTASATNPEIAARLMVTYHLQPGSFRAVDVGRRRTAGDILSIAGESSTNQLAAVTRLVITHDRMVREGAEVALAFRKSAVPTVDEVFDKLATDPGIRDVVMYWVNTKSSTSLRRFMTPSATYASDYVLQRAGHSPETVAKFWEGVFEGANLAPNDARLALRNNLYNARVSRKRTVALADMALAIKAFNAWVNGRYLHHLVWRTNEGFPRVVTAAEVTAAAQ